MTYLSFPRFGWCGGRHGLGPFGASRTVCGEAVLVTHGHKTFHMPTAQFVAVVDATGAEDSFNGAYLAARIRGANTTEAAGTSRSPCRYDPRETGKVARLPTPELQLTSD